jgi:hypothetical protein
MLFAAALVENLELVPERVLRMYVPHQCPAVCPHQFLPGSSFTDLGPTSTTMVLPF